MTGDRAPAGRRLVGPAWALNLEAGDHDVTTDSVGLAAAERAIEGSWAEFPYYATRYGDRGRRFSTSDSAWLVTLCRLPQTTAVAHVLWLGTVLGSRGMPRWLLEHHLGLLADELSRARPGDAARRYDALRAGAAELRGRRLAHLDETAFDALEQGFARRVDPAELDPVRRMGGMLAAAVTDERDGVKAAVSSLVSWAGDPARFSGAWVGAVHETVAAARRRAR